MLILKEYYPLQVLQIFAGVTRQSYYSNSKKQFIYSIIAICSAIFQIGLGFGCMYWVFPIVIKNVEVINVHSNVTKVEDLNEATNTIFRISISLLINIIAIVLRIHNILKASKLAEIFEEINRIDHLLRITNNYSKSSRRRVFGLVILLLLICWIVHVPYLGFIIYSQMYDFLFYRLCNHFAQFTIASVEWSQMIFFVLLKRRYSILNGELNLIHTSVANHNYSEEAIISTWFDPAPESAPETVDNSIENGGKYKIWNYLNNGKETSSSKHQATLKIIKQKVNSKRKQKKTTCWQNIPSNILRISTAQELEILRIVHQQLSTMLMKITSFFRFQIFLSFCSDLISLLDNLHYIVQHLIEPWRGAIPVMRLLRRPIFYTTWTLEYFTRIICIVWSHSSTISEAKNTLLHLERLQAPLSLRNYQGALEELGYFKRHMQSEVALSSSGTPIDFHGSLILRVIDISINYVFVILQQTFRKQ
ncbi:Gustatory receptor 30 [Cephus cinctus]|nr:Gustatory receptor 30 [Cephus cinctus]